MSILQKWLAGWSFRTSTPDFEPGLTIEVMVTAVDDGHATARIGDSTLRIDGAPADALYTRILVEIDAWDVDANAGESTYLETVGKSSF
ncbi:MAG: hypothetical protein V5A34_01780 [Halapricum sp.]